MDLIYAVSSDRSELYFVIIIFVIALSLSCFYFCCDSTYRNYFYFDGGLMAKEHSAHRVITQLNADVIRLEELESIVITHRENAVIKVEPA